MQNIVGLTCFIVFVYCRQYSVDYKLDTYLKIARLYLEDNDPIQAEAFINRASLLQVCISYCSTMNSLNSP